MSNTTYLLQTATFAGDYADILIETLAITPANCQSIKDALYHFRHLDDAQAAETMQHMADRIETNIDSLIQKLLRQQRQVAVIWCIADVKHVRPDLTDDKALEVLEECSDKHDCEWGFTWTFIKDVADELFGHAPETDETEEE